MKFRFVADHRDRWTITKMCDVLGVTRQGFYAWRNRPPSRRAQRDDALRGSIHDVFFAMRRSYGSPRIYRELKKRGERVSRKRVARLMREAGLEAHVSRVSRRTTQSNHDRPVAPNVVNRKFDVDTPNTVWTSDITYVKTRGGFAYLACVQDLYSRKIVGWSIAKTMHAKLVCDALNQAVVKRQPAPGLVVHSDRGVQYASAEYQDLLKQRNFTCSMSRRANCWDNAPMESFFRTLKIERLYRVDLRDFEHARRTVSEYIDDFYNRKRMHSTLGFRSPVEYEKITQRAA